MNGESLSEVRYECAQIGRHRHAVQFRKTLTMSDYHNLKIK